VWNGIAWKIQKTPNPKGAAGSYYGSYLSGVACPSTRACTAVGYYENSSGDDFALAAAWNGTAWTIQKTPNPKAAKRSFLYGVACSSTHACTAVGDHLSPTKAEVVFALAEAWNGTAWTIQKTPIPKGDISESFLHAVACRSTRACTAVGDFDDGTLAEAWNGSAWTIQPTPNPKVSTASELYGVACTATTACTAVGYNAGLSVVKTLAEAES